MITGFNTDIQHEGVTYHVQTEDKGLETPLILSLVYVGGAIIASKRTPYEDLLTSGFDEKVLTERLNRQHKLICAAIRAGRVADLKRMGGQAQPEKPAEAEGRPASEKTKTQRKKKLDAAQATAARKASEAARAVSQDAASAAEAAGEASAPAEAVAPFEFAEDGRAGADAFEEGRAASGAEKSLGDEIVILTTLVDEIEALGGVTSFQPPVFKSEPIEKLPLHEDIPVAPKPFEPPPPEPIEQPAPAPQDTTDELYLALLDDEGDFRAGQLVMIKVHVGRGAYGQMPVAGAEVTVKVLGTTFRPLILTSATDQTGVAVVRALLPRFTSGRAAIIIRAVDGEEAAEMRRIIHQA